MGLIASAKANGGSTYTTGAVDTTGATFLVVHVGQFQNVANISDSNGNTWTQLTTKTSGESKSTIYYSANPTVGSGHTFSQNTSSCFSAMVVGAFDSVATTSTFDAENGNTGAVITSLSTGIVTPANASSLVIAGISSGTGSSGYSINSSFTIVDSVDYSGGTSEGSGLAYIYLTSSSAQNPSWSWTGLSVGAATIAAFKGTAAAGGFFARTYYDRNIGGGQ